jgi:hypothetical protein
MITSQGRHDSLRCGILPRASGLPEQCAETTVLALRPSQKMGTCDAVNVGSSKPDKAPICHRHGAIVRAFLLSNLDGWIVRKAILPLFKIALITDVAAQEFPCQPGLVELVQIAKVCTCFVPSRPEHVGVGHRQVLLRRRQKAWRYKRDTQFWGETTRLTDTRKQHLAWCTLRHSGCIGSRMHPRGFTYLKAFACSCPA